MARLVKLVSAKSGTTPTARKVLSTTATTSAPTLSTEGVLLEGARYAWVTIGVTPSGGSPSATVVLYAYDPISLSWTKLLPSTEYQFSSIAANCRFRILVEGGPIRIQPVVTTLTDIGTLDVWIAAAVEEP